MQSSLLICDSGEFLVDEKVYKIGKSLNSISIPTIPYIVELYLFVKILYMSADSQYNIQILIHDEAEDLFYSSENKIVRNQRGDRLPGVDTSLLINKPFCKPGIYTVKLFVDEMLSSRCSIEVTLDS